MKKTINRTLYFSLAFFSMLVACRQEQKKTEVVQSKDQLLKKVETVVAIGKVTPSEGWSLVASSASGTIARIFVQEGDTVTKGQRLIELLDNNSVSLDAQQATTQLGVLQQQRQSAEEDLKREEIKLIELKNKYQTSKELLTQQAETKENTDIDWSNWQQQEKRIAGLRHQVALEKQQEQEQRIVIDKAQRKQSDLFVQATQAGTITDLDAAVGQVVSANTELGKIANIGSLRIKGEVDELFADKVHIGQEVTLYSVGSKDSVGSGTISYIAPTLVNKSILYETVNEGEDRRVRRIHITPKGNGSLLVNAKVECQIKIR